VKQFNQRTMRQKVSI